MLKNLSRLDEIPEKLKEKIFLKLFEVAKIANYNEQEQYAYQDSLKYYRDMKNVIDTAVEEAVKEALEKAEEKTKAAMEEVANEKTVLIIKNSIQSGLSNEVIAQITGVNIETIEKIRI